jgi:glycosyltransferase involved in cell wall biosynthesis
MRTRRQKFFDKLICYWCWFYYGIVDKVRLFWARDNYAEARDTWTDYLRFDWADGPLVSIIMPTIGRDATKAIKSVLAQTYKNWELIIVLDGGDEVTNNVLRWWPQKFNSNLKIHLCTYLGEKKLHYPDTPLYHWLVGPANAINYGLSKAKGAWIARIDDDDEWMPKHLESALEQCYEYNAEFFSSRVLLNYEVPEPYVLYGKRLGSVQTYVYRSYLKTFRCSMHSWRWYPGNNDIDLPKRMFRAGVRSIYNSTETHAIIRPREGLTETGLKGWMQEHEE